MSLEDILNYLPVVFLYVLSSYNPYPGREEHDEDFSHDDGRVRLSTWVHIDMKRHIDSYLRQHAYAVKPGSTEMQRLHQRIVEKREELTALNGGRRPTREQIAEAMDESISPSEYAAIMNNDVLSLDTKCRKQDEDEETTHADMLEARPDNVERSYNPRIYLKKRASTPELKEAVDKILYSDESLTSEEKSQLGT
jgi:DNA-directed RNA polymerase specialized sigma subunit